MSRIVKILVLWFAVATVGCITAQAQNCGDWLKVTAWTGTYTLTREDSPTLSLPPAAFSITFTRWNSF
jgi:hypothetical protein